MALTYGAHERCLAVGTKLPLSVQPEAADTPAPSVITIGVFDGVHLGHRQLVACTVERAKTLGLRSVAVTFDPHPREVLGKAQGVTYLSHIFERTELLRQLGAGAVAVLHFSSAVAALTAEEFVSSLRTRLGLRELWVGPDFALGRGREGTVPVLRSIGGRLGFAVHTVSPVVLDGTIVSSSSIRNRLTAGDVEGAASLLGRPYALGGEVALGEQRGRTLGFPTANLAVDLRRTLPSDGVYAVNAVVGDQAFPAAASIGVRPTFGNHARNLEVHILDYAAELYGQPMKVEFLKRVRSEQRFTSVDQLVAQMRRDVESVRDYFAARALEDRRVDA